MSTNLHIMVVHGKELSPEDMQTINDARLKEFGSTLAINPQPGNDDWTKIYFLAKEDQRLVSFGRLHNVDLTFEQQVYPIWGIATVIALEKGKGYGKSLMNAIQKYIKGTGKTGIGFCNQKLTPFYEKCGFGIMPDGQKRFKYTNPPRFPGSDAIYVKGKDSLIDKMLKSPNHVAQISIPHW